MSGSTSKSPLGTEAQSGVSKQQASTSPDRDRKGDATLGEEGPSIGKSRAWGAHWSVKWAAVCACFIWWVLYTLWHWLVVQPYKRCRAHALAIMLDVHEWLHPLCFSCTISGACDDSGPVVVMLDSGASACFISEACAQRCGLHPVPLSEEIEVELADGSRAVARYCLPGCRLQFLHSEGPRVKLPGVMLYVIDGMSSDVILGMRFLSKFNPTIDWHHRCMSFPKHGIYVYDDNAAYVASSVGKQASKPKPSWCISGIQLERIVHRRPNQQMFLVWVSSKGHRSKPMLWGKGLLCAMGLASESEPGVVNNTPPEIAALCEQYKDIFSKDFGLPPRRPGLDCKIDTGSNPPTAQRYYRHNIVQDKEIARQITELLDRGIIRPSCSPYASPVILVPKHDGSWRMCVDYRRLNTCTTPNKYPLPRQEDLFDQFKDAQLFSSLDLSQGYHQLRMADDSIHKTAFVTKNGQYEYMVMPFGIKAGPSVFQSAMHHVLRPLVGKSVSIFLDDICVYSANLEQHLQHLEEVFKKLREHQFYLNRQKCTFAASSVKYLGHIISGKGIEVDPAKIQAIVDWPVPKTVHDVRSFLGLASYYRRFIHKFSHIATPLSDLTRGVVTKHGKIVWGAREQEAFDTLKHKLTEAPVLAIADPTRPFELHCDASNFAISGVLMQADLTDNKLHPIAYYSQKLTPVQSTYPARDREFMAVLNSFKVWDHYLSCQHTVVETDHESLKSFWTSPNFGHRQLRWVVELEQYDFEVKHLPGRLNIVADALSRRPDLCPAPGCARVDLAAATVCESALWQQLRDAAKSDMEYQQLVVDINDELADDDLQVHDGLIYQVSSRGTRVLVPDDINCIATLLHDVHDAPVAGHMGYARTLKLLSRHFKWPHMAADVKQYCDSCPVCQVSKPSTQRKAGLLKPLPVPERKWQHITMDFLVGLPVSKVGHDACLVVVDRLTKMVRLIPTTATATAVDIAQLVCEHVFKHYGMPEVILTDRDPKFTSAFWGEFFQALGCKVALSSAYHPQTDGQTERANRTIEQVLRCWLPASGEGWQHRLWCVEYSLNQAVNASTGFSPFYLMYGYDPVTPPILGKRECSKVQSVDEMAKSMSADLKAAREHLFKAQQQQKKYADKHRRDVHFKVGDEVLLSTENVMIKGACKKFKPRWCGPFTVEAVVSDVAVKLALPDTMHIHPVVHVSYLKHFVSRPGAAEPEYFVPVIGEPEPSTIRLVLSHRIVQHGQKQWYEYLVLWHNKPLCEASWVRQHAFDDCPAVLRAYQQQQGLKKFKPLPDLPNAAADDVCMVDAHLDTFSSDDEG